MLNNSNNLFYILQKPKNLYLKKTYPESSQILTQYHINYDFGCLYGFNPNKVRYLKHKKIGSVENLSTSDERG